MRGDSKSWRGRQFPRHILVHPPGTLSRLPRRGGGNNCCWTHTLCMRHSRDKLYYSGRWSPCICLLSPHSLSFSFLAPITSVVASCERVRFPQQSAYRLLRTVFLLFSHIHYIHTHTTATVTCVYARQKDYHRDRLEVCCPCD